MADVVDWDLAVATGLRLAPAGPATGAAEAAAAVHQLRALAVGAVAPVRERTGLVADYHPHATEIVDRAAWITSNVAGMQVALSPLVDQLRDRKDSTSAAVTGIGSKATGLQLGAVLAWLSGKVLGQYEAFAPPGAQRRLLLVAPNVVSAEQALGVDPRDFRLWVCLHEETHRVQFGAVPWLAGHFTAEVHALLAASEPDLGELLRRLVAVLRSVAAGVAGRPGGGGLLEALQTPQQREVFDRLTALMSLLEGHADVIMDDVGPRVVPSVAVIRERFERRRAHPGAIDGLARRFLGLDAKLRQYSEGAAFVRGVVERVGMAGFNRVWDSPATLPTREEIGEPAAWVRRVHPGAASA